MKKRRVIGQNETLWFVSYSDLITAILAVLVLMMSFSKIDIEKVDHANRLMKDDKLVTLSALKVEYEKLIISQNLQKLVSINLNEDGLSINTSSTVQFAINSAKLDKDGIKLLEPIMNKLIEDGKFREISIVGHTDDVGSNIRNWKLSSQRAYSVLLYLINKGLDSKYTKIVAHSSNKPLDNPNKYNTPNERKIARSKNRRVTIVIGSSHS